jgi:hypothetical protein
MSSLLFFSMKAGRRLFPVSLFPGREKSGIMKLEGRRNSWIARVRETTKREASP